jgi:hypothetical protein
VRTAAVAAKTTENAPEQDVGPIQASEEQLVELPFSVFQPDEQPLERPISDREFPPEIESKLNAVWDAFDAIKKPTTGQMDDLLTALLALPPEATYWGDVFHRFARAEHTDLPGVFRRICAAVPHAENTGLPFFYWGAAEEFIRSGQNELLPEVAAGFRKLDRDSYDADALTHLEDYLLAEQLDEETLALAEHFLPIERDDGGLMPYAFPQRCQLIFELRVGEVIRKATRHEPRQLAEDLIRDLEDEIAADCAQVAVEIVCGSVPKHAWIRTDFDLVQGDIYKDRQAWHDCLRLFGNLVRVAQEAWDLEKMSPASTVRGLTHVLNSVYDQQDSRSKRSKKKSSRNLLDCLRPPGLEARIVQSCRAMLGCNMARARLQLRAYRVLTTFAARHQLMPASEIESTENELSRLRSVMDGAE